MTEIKWIKISTDMPDDEKIKIIDTMPDRDAIWVIWIKLIIQAGKCNDGGFIWLSPSKPFSDETLATVFNRPVNTVRLALDAFRGLEMIEIKENGVILLTNFEKHQNIEGMERVRFFNRERVRKFRSRHNDTKQLELRTNTHDPSPSSLVAKSGLPNNYHAQDETEKGILCKGSSPILGTGNVTSRYSNAADLDLDKTKTKIREREEDISIYVNYWETIKKNLATQVNKGNYDCNVAPLQAAGADNETLILTADRADIVDRVESMRNLIEKELVTVTGGALKHFTIFVERAEE